MDVAREVQGSALATSWVRKKKQKVEKIESSILEEDFMKQFIIKYEFYKEGRQI